MDLNELQSVQSRERQTDSLQLLRASFYRDAADYIGDLEAERDAAAQHADDPWNSPEVGRLNDDIDTAKGTVEAIYERRVGKIVKMASLAAADMPTDDEGLTDEEQALFDQLVTAIEQNREGVFAILDGEDPPVDPSSTGPVDQAGGAEPGPSADAGPPANARGPADASTTDTDASPPSTAAESPGEFASDADEERREVPPDLGDPADGPPVDEPPADDSLTEDPPADDQRVGAADLMGGDSGTDDAPDDTGPGDPGSDAPSGDTAAERSGQPVRDGGSADVRSGASTARGDGTTQSPDAGSGPVEGREPDTNTESPASATADDSAASTARAGAGGSEDPGTTAAGVGSDDEPTTIDRSMVRITDDVGPIYGVEGREYDLTADDVVTLPEPNVGPLLEQGAAERLD